MRTPERILRPVAVSPGYIVWETAGPEESAIASTVEQRDLRTKRVRTLAVGTNPDRGVASTARWVVYAAGNGSTLLAVRHDGSQRHVLSKLLVAPIASRGKRVAWVEQDNRRQRVYVLDTATGKRWFAADVPRCVATHCYRIDNVALAEGGVVFTRGAIGPQPSFIVRRGFNDHAPLSQRLPNDPQPDLAPSSAGALYYYFGHGWYRWDFGALRPRLTRFRGAHQTAVLRLEQGNWFIRSPGTCGSVLTLIRADGRSSLIASSKSMIASAHLGADGCADLLDLELTGGQAISAWAFRHESADPNVEDAGLVGVVQSQTFGRP